jgi:hypothetical protein
LSQCPKNGSALPIFVHGSNKIMSMCLFDIALQ